MTDQIHNFINAKDADSPLDIIPVAGRIGAEIRGIALSGDIDPVHLPRSAPRWCGTRSYSSAIRIS